MCGRYTQSQALDALQIRFSFADIDADDADNLQASFNIAPGQYHPVILQLQDRRMLRRMHWGLMPGSVAPLPNKPLINARSETVHQKRSFSNAFSKRRCLIPADGFYEWPKGAKTPYYITLPDHNLFAIAGIWEHRAMPGGASLNSYAVLTTEAIPAMEQIHSRMPAILSKEDEGHWLNPNNTEDELLNLLKPYQGEILCTRVSTLVNSVRHDSPKCIEPETLLWPE